MVGSNPLLTDSNGLPCASCEGITAAAAAASCFSSDIFSLVVVVVDVVDDVVVAKNRLAKNVK